MSSINLTIATVHIISLDIYVCHGFNVHENSVTRNISVEVTVESTHKSNSKPEISPTAINLRRSSKAFSFLNLTHVEWNKTFRNFTLSTFCYNNFNNLANICLYFQSSEKASLKFSSTPSSSQKTKPWSMEDETLKAWKNFALQNFIPKALAFGALSNLINFVILSRYWKCHCHRFMQANFCYHPQTVHQKHNKHLSFNYGIHRHIVSIVNLLVF